jgi:hypothetical protein
MSSVSAHDSSFERSAWYTCNRKYSPLMTSIGGLLLLTPVTVAIPAALPPG